MGNEEEMTWGGDMRGHGEGRWRGHGEGTWGMRRGEMERGHREGV